MTDELKPNEPLTIPTETPGADSTPPPEPPKAPTLAELGLEELKNLKVEQLKDLSASEGLPVSGTKAELLKRLRAKKLGGDRQVVKHNTLCQICKQKAVIHGTRVVSVLDDGRRVMQYSMRCTGRHGHRYSVTQVEGAKR